jgi:hypothetical protein
MPFTAIAEETPMLDLTAEPTDIYTEVAEETAARLAAAVGDPVPVEVETFESPFGKARVVKFTDGSSWFVAKDVCEGLGLHSKAGVADTLRSLKDSRNRFLGRPRFQIWMFSQPLLMITGHLLFRSSRAAASMIWFSKAGSQSPENTASGLRTP